jgi:hypothetical protein
LSREPDDGGKPPDDDTFRVIRRMMDRLDAPSREELEQMVADGVLDASKFFARRRRLVEPASIHRFAEQIGRPIRCVRFDGVEAAARLEPEHYEVYVPLAVKIISCRRAWRLERPDRPPATHYAGVLEVDGERFRYTSSMPLPLGRTRVIAYLTSERVGMKRLRPVVQVLAPEEPSRVAASEALRSLDDVRACFPRIVGEDVNIKLAILALASRLNLNRDFWIMGMIVQGESSSGKSYFTDEVLRPFKIMNRVEEFSRFTGAYLERKFRGRNMDDTIIVVYELFENTPQQLHVSMSEGRLRVGLVDRETGESVEYEFEGQPFLFSTTPLEAIKPDLRNRVITTSIDESDEQTRRIIDFETRLAADGTLGLILKDQARAGAERLAAHLASLKPAIVVVPWAEKLRDALTFYSTNLRRDWKKLLALVQASALLFQADRRAEERDGVRVVYADRRDLENLIAVMPAFTHTILNVSDAQKRMLDLMDQVGSNEYTTSALVHWALQSGWKVSARRLRAILDELETLGYVVIDRASGRENKYMKVRGYASLDLTSLLNVIEAGAEGADVSQNGDHMDRLEHPEQGGSRGCSGSESPQEGAEDGSTAEEGDLEH